jgi:hypothetical protein
MAGKISTDIVLSDFGTKFFITDANLTFGETAEAIENLTEIVDVTSAENLGFSRGSQDYQILGQGGFPKKALLGYEVDDMTLNMVRTEQGANNEGSPYWILNNKLAQFKVNKAFFGLIIVRPVAALGTDDEYEARYWTCFCSGIDEGATTDAGREYSVTLARSGKPTDLTVTTTVDEEGKEIFKFARKSDTQTGA